MLKKPIWSAIETTLFYYSGDSTTGQVCFRSFQWSLCEMWSFDLTKAFDLLDHAKVLELLHKSGISGGFGQSIESWLTDRYQYVEVNGIKSKNL